MSVLRTEKLNKNLYINYIFILIILIILINFSAVRPIRNHEANDDTASFGVSFVNNSLTNSYLFSFLLYLCEYQPKLGCI